MIGGLPQDASIQPGAAFENFGAQQPVEPVKVCGHFAAPLEIERALQVNQYIEGLVQVQCLSLDVAGIRCCRPGVQKTHEAIIGVDKDICHALSLNPLLAIRFAGIHGHYRPEDEDEDEDAAVFPEAPFREPI